ncbi:hypothetical protein V5O48_004035 [Marasmius crinis-equi]|uniref:Uncharacterized protein n=1 Tax=Marasmius crinis-equi TaxID=585013 RepID=A0ABR3FRK9_9AGAR
MPRANEAPTPTGSKSKQHAANNENLRLILNNGRVTCGLARIPPAPPAMLGTLQKTEMFIGATSVFSPDDRRYRELGKIAFISQYQGARRRTFHPDDGLPSWFLDRNQDVLTCLTRRRDIQFPNDKGASHSAGQQATCSTTATPAGAGYSKVLKTSPSTPLHKASHSAPAISTMPAKRPILAIDGGNELELKGNEDAGPIILSDSEPDDSPIVISDSEPESDDIILGSDATVVDDDNEETHADEEPKGKGKLKVDNGRVERQSAPEKEVDHIAVNNTIPQRINLPILKKDGGFINIGVMKEELGKLGIEMPHSEVERYVEMEDECRWVRINWGTPFYVWRSQPIGLKLSSVKHMLSWEDYKVHTFYRRF